MASTQTKGKPMKKNYGRYLTAAVVALGASTSILGGVAHAQNLSELASGRGTAQQSQVAGQWRCQIAARTMINDRNQNWIYEFTLALDPNGSFQAQGTYLAEVVGAPQRFQAQGKWRLQQDQFRLSGQGQEEREEFWHSGLYRGPFVLAFKNVSPKVLSSETQSLGARLLSYCQR